MLAQELRTCFRYDPPRGYREGKQRVRKMIERFYPRSGEAAEHLVRRLERQGYMYTQARAGAVRWRFDPHPVDSNT